MIIRRGRQCFRNMQIFRLHSSVIPKETSTKLVLPYIYEIEENYQDIFQMTSEETSSYYFSEAISIDETQDKYSASKFQPLPSPRHLDMKAAISAMSSASPPGEFPSSSQQLTLEQRQLQIEKRQTTFGELESLEMTKKLIDMGKSASLKSLQKIFLQWYDPFYNSLLQEKENFKKGTSTTNDVKYFGPLLVQLPLEKIAVTVLNTTLDLILQSKNTGVQISILANEISNILQIEKNSILLQVNDRKKKQWLQDLTQEALGKRSKIPLVSKKILRCLDAKEWEHDVKLKIGVALISKLIDVCRDEMTNESTFRHDYKESTGSNIRYIGVIRLSDSVYELLLTEIDHNTSNTRFLPMLVPPVPWTNHHCGGYLTHHTTLLRYRSRSQLSVLKLADLSNVHRSLNYLGSIPWRINKRVIDVMKELYARGESVGDLPSREILSEPSEENFFVPRSSLKYYQQSSSPSSTNESSADPNELVLDTREYRYQCKRIRQKNAENHSLRCDLEIKFSIADEFRDDVIYFPWNVDFRGRAYPVPPNLNHMGSDKCRGMLYFAEGKPLGKRGFEWLKIHLCNLFGNNKIPLEERVKWTEDHISDIHDSAINPIHGSRWWATAEEPYQALATCIEISEALKYGKPEEYVCHLPVHQDGSCNGLQHYAALGRDYSGGSAVNLTPADRPQDVYTEVLKRVLVRIDEDAAYDSDRIPEVVGASTDSRLLLKQIHEKNKKFAKLIQGKVDRKVIKQTVMTSVYGVTPIGARDQVHSKLAEKLFPHGTLNQEEDSEAFAAASYLAKLTLLSLGDLFSSADEIMNWLGETAAAVGSQGHVMSWITPLGLPVMQPYRKQVGHTVRTILQNITLSYEDEALPVSRQKQRTAFPPNYVHSLDSTHMMMTSLKMQERGLQFTAVHDSFWTHACDVDVMNEELRNCFVELYKLPLLETLKESIELRYPLLNLPPVPARGELDIESVKESPYFFH